MKGALMLCVVSALLPGLHGLKCAQCPIETPNCQATCEEAGQICIAIQGVSTTEPPSVSGTYKGCVAREKCKLLSVTLSTFSTDHFQSTTACCESHECNANLTLSASPTGSRQNGVSCPVCRKTDDPQSPCKSNGYLACTGLEEKCITLEGSSLDGNAKNFSLRGCASRNACDMRVNDTFAYQGVVYHLDKNATCTDRGTWSALSNPAAMWLPAIAGYLAVHALPDL